MEIHRRLRAQTSLAACIDYRQAGYAPSAHHRLLIEKLEAVERGEIPRLMVCMPPGSAKSTYSSIEFPAWALGRNPKMSVIAASHTQELADRFGRRVRNVVASAEFGRVFGVGVADDSSSAGRWDTTRGGEYFAAGVGGSITGRRADLVVIDDPVKSREDADSERSREKAWDWYVNDLLTRLKPGARQIVVMTRWHEDDLGGRILERERDKWHLLELPMEAMEGDPLGRKVGERLWPDWFTDEMVAQAKRDQRSWSALYQQQPSAFEGTFFKREWFKRYKTAPRALHTYITSDHAPAGGDSSDYTCVRVWGVDTFGDLYLLDGFRHQETLDKSADRVIGIKREGYAGLIQRHKPFCWFPEDDNNWKSAAGFVTRMMREQNVHCRIEPISPHGSDKQTKAQPFQAMAASGRVWLPEGPVGDDVLAQYLKFPAGKNDDEVDAAAIMGRALGDTHPAIAQVERPRQQEDRWAKAFGNETDEEESWKTS